MPIKTSAEYSPRDRVRVPPNGPGGASVGGLGGEGAALNLAVTAGYMYIDGFGGSWLGPSQKEQSEWNLKNGSS